MLPRLLGFLRSSSAPDGLGVEQGREFEAAAGSDASAERQLGPAVEPGGPLLADEEVMLRVRGLSKIFVHGGRRLEVLRCIDLDLKEGEMTSVVGMSGAGKSTLLHILGALDRPTGGEICFNGRRLSQMSSAQLASFRNGAIGFVFQFHHLLPELTALENVMMPRLVSRSSRKEAAEIADDLLRSVGLAERMTHRPSELSGGEQQRVALARALAMRPKLLLADEPTGNLDSHTSGAIHELFFGLNEQYKTTMLMVTHNQSLAHRMPRCLVMVDGRLERFGNAAVSP